MAQFKKAQFNPIIDKYYPGTEPNKKVNRRGANHIYRKLTKWEREFIGKNSHLGRSGLYEDLNLKGQIPLTVFSNRIYKIRGFHPPTKQIASR